MSKLLFLVVVGVVVYVVLRGMRARERERGGPSAPSAPPATSPAQQMVICAQCGVHLPENDSLISAGQHYCCEQHRELGPLARKS